ncbi:hypothetical protein BDW75DRAFT_200319 [Aspergillus navahoensis]
MAEQIVESRYLDIKKLNSLLKQRFPQEGECLIKVSSLPRLKASSCSDSDFLCSFSVCVPRAPACKALYAARWA